MITRPFEAIAGLAKKVQVVATRVALKAARVSEAMARKVASIEARAQARAQAAALRKLPRKPTVELLRELRHGRVSVSIYRVINHRAGEVRQVWGLNRVLPDGRRVRLATGSISELRSLATVLNRSLAQENKARQEVEPARRPEGPSRQATPTRRTEEQSPSADHGPRRWYTLIYVEKLAPDGAGKGRVVRNVASLKEAEAHQKRHPGLVILERTGERPLRQGEVVGVKLGKGPKAVEGVGEPRRDALKQEGPKLAVVPPAQKQERRLNQGR